MPDNFETIIDNIDEGMVTAGDIEKLQDDRAIQKGAALLRKGEIIAFPTETVYGLGADATREEPVRKIFKAKGRPQDNPLIVHIASQNWLPDIVKGGIPSAGKKLIATFWPGPLTIILNKSSLISDRTTAGLDSVAVRMPSHPIALALIAKLSLPVAAPSANSSGYPSPTRAEHVYYDLQGKIPYIIDGGSCPVGVESTVVDIRGNTPEILRPGGITREEINKVLGSRMFSVNKSSGEDGNNQIVKSDSTKENIEKEEDAVSGEAGGNMESKVPVAPGMKYRHYSPVTPLKLCQKSDLGRIDNLLEEYKNKYKIKKIALVVTRETAKKLGNSYRAKLTKYIKMGSVNDLKEIAHNIFSILRQLDQEELDLILVESIPARGLGEAIMNRLHKAAGQDIHLN